MSDLLRGTIFGVAIALVAVAFFHLGRLCPIESRESGAKVIRDTIYRTDTITAYTAKEIVRRRVDTIRVSVRDTIRERDTLFIALPREQIEWHDTLATIWASGYEPRIDSVRHFCQIRQVTERVPVPVKVHPNWGVGVTAGYGASKEGLSPFVGVGVSWIIASW